MSEENKTLVGQILAEAALESERIIAQARSYAEEKSRRAEEDAARFLAERKEIGEREAQEKIKRKETLALLETRKALLGVKQEIVDGIYRRAVGRMNDMSESQYLAFLDGLISHYAEEGDTVVFAQSCPISKDKLIALPSVKKMKLALSFEGKFSGGIVLSGSTCDKDLTFASVCAAVREETEADLSQTLFGDK